MRYFSIDQRGGPAIPSSPKNVPLDLKPNDLLSQTKRPIALKTYRSKKTQCPHSCQLSDCQLCPWCRIGGGSAPNRISFWPYTRPMYPYSKPGTTILRAKLQRRCVFLEQTAFGAVGFCFQDTGLSDKWTFGPTAHFLFYCGVEIMELSEHWAFSRLTKAVTQNLLSLMTYLPLIKSLVTIYKHFLNRTW